MVGLIVSGNVVFREAVLDIRLLFLYIVDSDRANTGPSCGIPAHERISPIYLGVLSFLSFGR